ncbi:MAG: hypothetical protein LBC88_04910 [Spirochaetaceae bacterium]|jgi:hypothetical protein|nr:hypothetical protein [Spirochaetaceae bacterium]
MIRRLYRTALWVLFLACACAARAPVDFPVSVPETELYGCSREAITGRLRFTARGSVLRYEFDPPLTVPVNASMEVAYVYNGEPDAISVTAGYGDTGYGDEAPRAVLSFAENGAWRLPLDTAFLDIPPAETLRYAAPVAPGTLRGFTLTGTAPQKSAAGGCGVVEIRGVRLVPRWYGFEAAPRSDAVLTPFVYRSSALHFVIDPPGQFDFSVPVSLVIRDFSGEAAFTAGRVRVEYAGGAAAPGGAIRLPPFFLRRENGAFPLAVETRSCPGAVILAAEEARDGATLLDPALILNYPEELWRDGRFEVFRWDGFPEILIFDTKNYAVQDRLFKRLAFFVEKAGFRGRLASDAELSSLHGWNAHDYRAEDLAAFFTAARQSGFPLSAEERELEALLLDHGVIRYDGAETLVPGRGAVISVSRESPAYLRRRFMVHEAFHGLFFLDEDFRAFSRRRWEQLEDEAQRFLRSFFDFQRYDITDPYLLVNEFMAYCLQQEADQAGAYFGETLARQLDSHPWRGSVLPPPEYNRDGGKTWPLLAEIFAREARAFSGYVNRRWGFSAGNVFRFRISISP